MNSIPGKIYPTARLPESAAGFRKLDRISSRWSERPWRTAIPSCCWLRKWQNGLGLPLRATASESESLSLKKAIEQVEKMRASAIKEELTVLGVSFADCFEKHELALRLASARLSKNKKTEDTSLKDKGCKALARMPMMRLRSTLESPKDYILVPLKINNQGPFNFILDTASTITLIAPSIVYDRLRITPNPAQTTVGLFGGGASNQSFLSVNLAHVNLGEHTLDPITVR
eukprot:TRINITY_DN9533_c0_g1_i1.p1 TRINITY_DN9533_c0_g1~~TRINITY_DN9533_c0_g1_i1.p1  ORF type:complete len:230 (+),score=27.75 TRINITY_DN9533_c0_g1_i1:109-798(+)